tara:strand:- start:950 stop:1471 length:522 start_codon:yes stop_codon:yes gene_type:complete
MKFFKIVFFLFILQCAGPFNKVEKVYICGDHKCANKAEADEYFNNNISIEIYSIDTKKDDDEYFDLVDLNLLKDKLASKKKITVKDEKKKIDEKIKERKKLAKLKIKEIEKPSELVQKDQKKIDKIEKIKPKKQKSKIAFIRICKNLDECDIDKISKIIMEIGKEKDFPDITN